MDEDYTIEDPGDQPVCVYDLPATSEAMTFEAAYRFVENRQHDHLMMLWDGSSREVEMANYLRERYYPRGFAPVNPGPDAVRKPELTTPMAATIVMRNTGLLLGTDPVLDMPVDDDSEALIRAIYTAGSLRLPFGHARNMAGGGGAAVLVQGIIGGQPCVTVGRPSEFKVLKWSDRESWQPERIVQQVLVTRWIRDRNGNRRQKDFWQTTEWDNVHRITYKLVPTDWPKEKRIPLDPATPLYKHGCRRCPVTWYKNSDTDYLFGATDFAGLEPRMDGVDRLGTHLYTAIGKNCDPTVYQADDEGTRRRHRMGKRGRNVLVELSEKGRIGVMEVAGTSLDVTYKFWRNLQDDTYATADCIRVTPDTAGAFKTGEAIRLLWRSSEVRVGWLWPQLAKVIRRVMENFIAMADHFGVSSYENPKTGTIILPSRIVPATRPKRAPPPPPPPVVDADGNEAPAPLRQRPTIPAPEEKPEPTLKPHRVGAFGYIEIGHGPYFAKTPAEKAAEMTTVQAAAGGGKVLSEETAVEQAAKSLGIDPEEELRRVHEEAERSIDNFGAGAGGLADANAELGADADDREPEKPSAEAEEEADDGGEDE